jgi:hypothetical protein
MKLFSHERTLLGPRGQHPAVNDQNASGHKRTVTTCQHNDLISPEGHLTLRRSPKTTLHRQYLPDVQWHSKERD